MYERDYVSCATGQVVHQTAEMGSPQSSVQFPVVAEPLSVPQFPKRVCRLAWAGMYAGRADLACDWRLV